MLASIVMAAVSAAFSPGFDGAELLCRPQGGAVLRVWRGEEARPARQMLRTAPGGSRLVVSLSDWSVDVRPMAGPTGELVLQVIDDATPGFTRASSTLLSCAAHSGAVRLQPARMAAVRSDQPSRLR